MPHIAILGGGFSGAALAANLVRLSSPAGPVRITLIERAPRFARGVAYGVPFLVCTLNVPAGRMSAFPDDPEHFLRWAKQRDPRVGGGSFPSRTLYGEYLGALLAQAEADAPAAGAVITRVRGDAVGIDPPGPGGHATVRLRDARKIEADAVVLALGNFPPCDPPIANTSFFDSPCYARDPWAPGVVETVPPGEPALIIGTGLTMLDIALALQSAGHEGVIHAVSRRGLLPQPHRVSIRPPRTLPFPESLRPLLQGAHLRTIVRALREEVARGARRGDDWREVVTSLRGQTPALWKALSDDDRRQFLRHVQPFWETHRHRASPETAAAIADLIERGRLVIHAARVIDICEHGQGALATLRPRGSDETIPLQVARVINCTGPDTNLSRSTEPLLRSLRDAGLIRPDSLGLGLDTGPEGEALDAAGSPSPWLSVLGPMRKADLWESTAVPELRVHARALAERLAAEVAAARDQ